MFEVDAELLGTPSQTDKGYVGKFLIVAESGKKDVISVFSRDLNKLKTGKLELSQNFFFLS